MREPCRHGVVRCLSQVLPQGSKLTLMTSVLCFACLSKVSASPEEDAKAVAALDTKYQAAVKANDAAQWTRFWLTTSC
jgi:hypothetical protein